MNAKSIKTALISVYYKDNLEPIVHKLHALGVQIFSTGGTYTFIEGLGIPVTAIEELTTYPSILDGRVKTLHPKIFGGILAKRDSNHLEQLEKYDIPTIDLVIVDLYPFEQTVATTNDEPTIIEKIDIGGISLIRAAAKNFKEVAIVPSRADYSYLLELLDVHNGYTLEIERRELARRAFDVSSNYDTAIFNWLDNSDEMDGDIYESPIQLRYGENPHQSATFYGDLTQIFDKLNGKELSYNNLVDVDAAIQLISDFQEADATFAIIKHTNACGVASRPTAFEAWEAAFACDTTSAFGGIIITNKPIDLPTATAMNDLFFEVVIAPDYDLDALAILQKKKNRIILRQKQTVLQEKQSKNILNGVLEQEANLSTESADSFNVVTNAAPSIAQIDDLVFANICVKHLKSNAIALVKNKQLIGMGCGQTSRVDALKQALEKAKNFNFNIKEAVLASDAFFPFNDCVEIAHQAGIAAIVQPGGSVRDQDSIDACNNYELPMVFTGKRHFKH